jgi:hypothetical protein
LRISSFSVLAPLLLISPVTAQPDLWRKTTTFEFQGPRVTLKGVAIRSISWNGQSSKPIFELSCSKNWSQVAIDWKIKGIISDEPIHILVHPRSEVTPNRIVLRWESSGIENNSVLHVSATSVRLISRAIEDASVFSVLMNTSDGQTILAQFTGTTLSNDEFRTACGNDG